MLPLYLLALGRACQCLLVPRACWCLQVLLLGTGVAAPAAAGSSQAGNRPAALPALLTRPRQPVPRPSAAIRVAIGMAQPREVVLVVGKGEPVMLMLKEGFCGRGGWGWEAACPDERGLLGGAARASTRLHEAACAACCWTGSAPGSRARLRRICQPPLRGHAATTPPLHHPRTPSKPKPIQNNPRRPQGLPGNLGWRGL